MSIKLNDFYGAYVAVGISYYDHETDSIVDDEVNFNKVMSLIKSSAGCSAVGHFVRNQKPSGAYSPPRYLLIPKPNAKEAIYSYIDQAADESYKALLDLPGDDIIHAFHVKVTDDGFFDQWEYFEYNYILDKAAKWCDQHNIKYFREPFAPIC